MTYLRLLLLVFIACLLQKGCGNHPRDASPSAIFFRRFQSWSEEENPSSVVLPDMRLALTTAAFIASAAAHATFQELWINGVDAGNSCVRLPASNSPVQSVTTNDLACNIAGTSQGVCSVNAGDQLTVEMHQQPGDRSCSNEAIGGDHFGPVQVYMAAVSDARTAVGSSQSWFKVAEMGMPSNNPNYWGTQVLNDNCGHFTFTVPKDIAPGNYLVRAEVIALHVASSAGGAQFYMSCYQINVSGSGSAKPPTVKFPGAYSANDPGILINIHQTLSTYVIPGPTPYGTTAPSVAATPWPTTATWNTANQPKTVPTVVPGGPQTTPSSGSGSTTAGGSPATTTVQTSAPSPTSGAGAASLYGQCGGNGWTGPTSCAQGTCQVLNPYYSQCLN